MIFISYLSATVARSMDNCFFFMIFFFLIPSCKGFVPPCGLQTYSINCVFTNTFPLKEVCLNLCSYWWFISENEFVMSQVISNFTTVTLHRHDLLQVVTSKFWLEDQRYPPACQVQCWRGNRRLTTLCVQYFSFVLFLFNLSIIFYLALCSYCVIENLKQF